RGHTTEGGPPTAEATGPAAGAPRPRAGTQRPTAGGKRPRPASAPAPLSGAPPHRRIIGLEESPAEPGSDRTLACPPARPRPAAGRKPRPPRRTLGSH